MDSASTRVILFTALAWMQPHGRDLHDSWQQVASLNLFLVGRMTTAVQMLS